MNWTIYCIECVASVALFTGSIMIPLCRNPVWWIHDYPADIQEKYFENHERIPTKKESQAAYRALGCMPAEEINEGLAAAEPFDVQMEYRL